MRSSECEQRTTARVCVGKKMIVDFATNLIDAGFDIEMFQDDAVGNRTFTVSHKSMPVEWQGEYLKCVVYPSNDLSDESREGLLVYPLNCRLEYTLMTFSLPETR